MSKPPLPSEVNPNKEDVFYFSHVDELPITSDGIRKATRKDRVFSRLHDFIANGLQNYLTQSESVVKPYFVHRNELSVDKGCVMWGARVVVPEKFREQLLEELHDQHLGMSLTKSLVRSYLWWPGLDKEIERVAGCNTCHVVGKNQAKTPTCTSLEMAGQSLAKVAC